MDSQVKSDKVQTGSEGTRSSPLTDELDCQTKYLLGSVFEYDVLRDMIVNFAIRNDDGQVSKESVLICRKINMSWLESVSRCLQRSQEHIFLFQLNSPNFVDFVKDYAISERIIGRLPPFRVTFSYTSLRRNEVTLAQYELLKICFRECNNGFLGFNLDLDYGYHSTRAILPDQEISILRNLNTFLERLTSRADEVYNLDVMVRVTKLRNSHSLMSFSEQLEFLEKNIKLLHVNDLTLTIDEIFILPTSRLLHETFPNVKKLVLSILANANSVDAIHLIFQKMTGLQILSLAFTEQMNSPREPEYWNDIFLGMQLEGEQLDQLPPGHVAVVTQLTALRELELCLQRTILQNQDSNLHLIPNSVTRIALKTMTNLNNLQITGEFYLPAAVVEEWKTTGKQILCRRTDI